MADSSKDFIGKPTSPNADATKLVHDLQRQFAERRRQNMANKAQSPKSGDPISSLASAAKAVSVADKHGLNKPKHIGPGRRKRRETKNKLREVVRDPSASKTIANAAGQASSSSKVEKEIPPNDGDHIGDNKLASSARKQASRKTIASILLEKGESSELSSNVRKLEEASEAPDKTKGILEAGSNDSKHPARKKGSLSLGLKPRKFLAQSSPTSSVSEGRLAGSEESDKILRHLSDAKDNAASAVSSENVQSSPTVTSKKRRTQSSSKAASRRPSDGVRKTPSKNTARSLDSPFEAESRKKVAIETVNAADLEITGK